MSRFYNEPSRIQFSEHAASLKTEISKQHNITVEKAMEFNKAIAITKNNITPDKIGYLAQGLEFSESAIQGSLQLASTPDLATPAIGNWTFGSLNMLIQEVGSSIDPDTRLSLAFPDKSVPMYKTMVDRIAGNTGILPEFAGDNAVLPTVRPLDTYGLEYQPALYAGRTMLNAKDIMFARKRGVGSFDERGIGQLVAYNSVNLITQALTRKKLLLNQAIFYNSFVFGGETISSNIPGANYIAMYEAMGTLNTDGSITYATSDPLYTPFIAITNILNNPMFIKYRPYIRGIIVNGADLQGMMNHPNVKPVTNLLMATNGTLNGKSMSVAIGDQVQTLNTYYAPGFEFPLIPDDGVWQNQTATGVGATSPNDAQSLYGQGAQNFFVPRGRMFVLLDITAFGGQLGAFHLTYNEVDPNIEAPAMGLFTGVFNRNLQNSDVTNRLDLVAALAGAPAVYMPEACFILTGLYSNYSGEL